MSFAPTSPITGATVTGLTSPTYTIVADTPPNAVSKQYAVSALGGTQTGVNVHTISSPFTLTMFRPQAFKVLGQPNSAGVISSFPVNRFEILARKGVNVLANQPTQVSMARLSLSIPAGCDTYDSIEWKAMLSAFFGALWANSNALVDTTLTGTL